MSDKPLENLFVYGPLMSGLIYFESYLGDLQVTPVPAKTKGRLVHLAEAGIPVLVDGDGEVVGEMVQIPTRAFDRLDYFRGYRGDDATDECLREKRTIATEDGEYEAWVYVSSNERLEKLGLEGEDVPDGDWRAFHEDNVRKTLKKNAGRFPSGI